MTKSVKNQIKGKIIAWQCPTPVSEVTRPKTNVEPQTGGLEDDFPFQMGDAQVPCYFSGVLQTTQEEIQSIPHTSFVSPVSPLDIAESGQLKIEI